MFLTGPASPQMTVNVSHTIHQHQHQHQHQHPHHNLVKWVTHFRYIIASPVRPMLFHPTFELASVPPNLPPPQRIPPSNSTPSTGCRTASHCEQLSLRHFSIVNIAAVPYATSTPDSSSPMSYDELSARAGELDATS
eukprot:1413005-Rhodomonas_salina.2